MTNKPYLIYILTFSYLSFLPGKVLAQAVDYREMIKRQYNPAFVRTIESNVMREHLIFKSTGNNNAPIKFHIFADLDEVFSQKFFKDNFPYLIRTYDQNVQFIYHHKIYLVESTTNLFFGHLTECLAQQGALWNNTLAFTSFLSVDDKVFDLVDKDLLKICLNDPTIKAEVRVDTAYSFDNTGIGVPAFVLYNTAKPTKGYTLISGIIPTDLLESELQKLADNALPTNTPSPDPSPSPTVKRPILSKISQLYENMLKNLQRTMNALFGKNRQ